jgi:tRNA pseudouridine38-40 synthase
VKEERRVAIKLAYDGTKFRGFQRQPEGETVEGALVRALGRIGAVSSPRECGYRSSSRTDRGVSALGNVVSFRTDFQVRSLCSAVNSELENAWACSAVSVPEDFNPRAARQRWYRYHLAKSGQSSEMLRELASRFVGVHDFSGHARVAGRNPMRKIDSIEISDSGMFHLIYFRAESFLWNMVRRIVWMMNEGSSGRMSPDLVGPEAPSRPRRIGLAPPEFLVLMDIDCGVVFPVDQKVALGIVRAIERRIRTSAMELAFAESMLDALRSPS